MDKKEYIGLYGKKIEKSVYYCKCHCIYMDENDVETKHCMCKHTMDMIDTQRCRWICTVEEYEAEQVHAKELRDACEAKRRIQKMLEEKGPNRTHNAKYKALVKKMLEDQKNG